MKRNVLYAFLMFLFVNFCAALLVFIINAGTFDLSSWDIGGRVFFGIMLVATLCFSVIPVFITTRNHY